MDRFKWSPPAAEPAQAASETRAAPRPAAEWFSRFVVNIAFFGLIGALLGSWFPPSVGAFLFVTDDNFIQWAFQAVGIRLIPESFGSVFIKSLILLAATTTLVVYWRDRAPPWLSVELPSGPPPWAMIAGTAALIAFLSTASSSLVELLIPEIARNSRSWSVARATIALAIFGVLALLAYAFRPI